MADRSADRRILVDLSHAADGFVGIAQDIRLIFAMLAGLPGVAPTGLLMTQKLHDLPRVRAGAGDQVAVAAGIVHWMSRAAGQAQRRSRIGRVLGPAREIRRVLRARHDTLTIRPELRDSLWRVLFGPTLPASARALVMDHPFLATDLSVARLLFRGGMFRNLPPVSLNLPETPGFDAVLFCNARPIRLPRGVQPLVRYHDAIPLTDADMVPLWQSGAIHQRMVQGTDRSTLFICDSPSSVQDLLLADPSREGKARIIPCALAPMQAGTDVPASSIIGARRTFRALGREPGQLPVVDEAPRYVLSISTFEPRKNFAGLVRAWERVLARHDPDLRLVLVAGRGWLEEDGLRLIAPHVASGRLIHLQDLPQDELQSLMRQSACFAFPSFAEGFGLPPLEALQAGTPVIASDLPVFRWTLGEAALLVDPYDTEALAAAIARLCTDPERDALRRRLSAAAVPVLARFTPGRVAEDWAALLDGLPRRQS